MLIKLGLAGLLALAAYGVILIYKKYFRNKRSAGTAVPLNLVVVVKNQEDSVEFFIRRIITEVHRGRFTKFKLTVADTGSTDDTVRILRRMSRMFGFELLEVPEEVDEKQLINSGRPTFYYDARGKSGTELARAPLFQLLAGAGQR